MTCYFPGQAGIVFAVTLVAIAMAMLHTGHITINAEDSTFEIQDPCGFSEDATLSSESHHETAYMAPFLNEHEEDDNYLPKHFMITLRPGRTVEELSNAIGTDVEALPGNAKHATATCKGIFFALDDVDEDLLAAIRSWEGVHHVERDGKAWVLEWWMNRGH